MTPVPLAAELAELAGQDAIRPDPAGVWRLDESHPRTAALRGDFQSDLFGALDAVLDAVAAGSGGPAGADLRGFLDLASLCGRNVPFEPLADLLALDRDRCDRLLDLLDAHLVDPPDGEGPAAEPLLDYLGVRHPGLPDCETFRFRNPLLAAELRQRLGPGRLAERAGSLRRHLERTLPIRSRTVAEVHLAVLGHCGDAVRPEIATALYNAADDLLWLGQAAEALGRFEEALAIRRLALPIDHWVTAIALGGTGRALQALGRPADALDRYTEALARLRRALPPGHPSIARTLAYEAEALEALGRLAEAQVAREESFALCSGQAAPGDPGVILDHCLYCGRWAALLGQRPGARYWLGQGLALPPSNLPWCLDLRERIAAALAGLGDPAADLCKNSV